ncbi:hypothetical protein [Acinetobacter sp. ANC 3832]|uniref:hypothetical protein n=1 Tax=Acinetobacter sp. ANC 3832 TaxID=1977874 RepID=UPI001D175883|nr:hypothetical protein [Acinetobacter sp. ANC 3832]
MDVNQTRFNQAKNLERTRDHNRNIEITFIFKSLINPLDIERLPINELRDLYCSLFIERINNPLFRIPKSVDYDRLKSDLLVLVEDLENIDFEII